MTKQLPASPQGVQPVNIKRVTQLIRLKALADAAAGRYLACVINEMRYMLSQDSKGLDLDHLLTFISVDGNHLRIVIVGEIYAA